MLGTEVSYELRLIASLVWWIRVRARIVGHVPVVVLEARCGGTRDGTVTGQLQAM